MKSPPLSQRSLGGKRQLVPGGWGNLLCFLLGAFAATALCFVFSRIKAPFFSERDAPIASRSGPWGQLEYTSIILERPEESQPDKIPAPQLCGPHVRLYRRPGRLH